MIGVQFERKTNKKKNFGAKHRVGFQVLVTIKIYHHIHIKRSLSFPFSTFQSEMCDSMINGLHITC